MNVLSIPTPTHGRVLVDGPEDATRVLIGCHGYAQNAAILLKDLNGIPGIDGWRRVSVQALSRFYTRGDEAVVAAVTPALVEERAHDPVPVLGANRPSFVLPISQLRLLLPEDWHAFLASRPEFVREWDGLTGMR